MTVSNHEEYQTANGETISIQQNDVGGVWEVGCWDADDQCRWYKEFDKSTEARAEFERWR